MSLAERIYRAALAAYPELYRAERGEEVLGTLLDATDGRRVPDLREVASILADAYRRRVLASVAPAHGAVRAGAAWAAYALAVLTAAVAVVGVMREDHLRYSLPPSVGRQLHVLGLVVDPWFAAFAATALATLVAVAASARRTALVLALAGLAVQLVELASAPVVPHPVASGHFAVYAWTNSAALPREPSNWLVPSLLLPVLLVLAARRPARSTLGRVVAVAVALGLAAGLAVATDHAYGAVAGLAVVLIPLIAVAVAVLPLDPRPALACLPLLATSVPLAVSYVVTDPTTPAAGDLTLLAGIPLAVLALAAAAAASTRRLRGRTGARR